MNNNSISHNDIQIIDISDENISKYGICGYKDIKKHTEITRKLDWIKKYHDKGLRIKALIADNDSCQGMIEYLPGEYAHRPVEAKGYMFIQCIFVGFKKEYKGKGFASSLIDKCILDAKNENMNGVSVVTRKSSFMAKKDIFIKKGFSLCDNAKPDFELLVLKFNQNKENPKFKDMNAFISNYKEGLTIIRSPQCPYSVKNVDSIIKTAENKLKIKVNLIDIDDAKEIQNTPCPFGTFSIIYNGEIISYHPISNTRFENIMKKILP